MKEIRISIVIIFFTFNLSSLGKETGNAIQITTTSRANLTTTLSVLFDEVQFFKGLEGLANDGSGSIVMLRGTETVVLTATENTGQGTNSSTRTDI